MKHLYNVPICSNSLFIYQLDVKNDLISKFKKEKFKSAQYSDGGCSLIGKDLNVLRKYKELNKEIIKAVNATIKDVLMLEDVNYRIFSSWLTKTDPGGSSDPHSHTNSWLSGVYYPKGNAGFNIKFFKPFLNL